MDLRFFRVTEKLLPRTGIFFLVVDRTLRKFFEGLSDKPATIREHIAGIVADAFPRTTERQADHSLQLGSPVTLSNAALEAEFAAAGGQSPGYFQSIIQAAGFDLYVHEWWVPGSDPVKARNPLDYLYTDSARQLVNDISSAEIKWRFQCGDGSQCQNFPASAEQYPIRMGMNDGYLFRAKEYAFPTDPSEYYSYFYLGGMTFPDAGCVDPARLKELERLIYKYKPAHLRCILISTDIYTGWGHEPWGHFSWE